MCQFSPTHPFKGFVAVAQATFPPPPQSLAFRIAECLVVPPAADDFLKSFKSAILTERCGGKKAAPRQRYKTRTLSCVKSKMIEN